MSLCLSLSHPLGGGVEVQSQLQPLLSLLSADAELLPDPIESRQSVSGRARRTAQRLTEDDSRLQQLTAVIVSALRDETKRVIYLSLESFPPLFDSLKF